VSKEEVYPSLSEFLSLAEQYNSIPVYRELTGDMFTAISLFMKIKKGRYQYLLESAVSGEYLGRFSFMGYSDCAIKCKDGNITLVEKERDVNIGNFKNPFEYVSDYFNKIEQYRNENLPPFAGGVVGYIGYDSIQYFEDITFSKPDVLQNNDFELIISNRIIVFDNLKNKIFIIYNATMNEDEEPELLYNKAIKEIDEIVADIKGKHPVIKKCDVSQEKERYVYKSNFSKDKFKASVKKTKEYIHDGDVFQTVISQRLKVSIAGDAFNLYRSLRIVNPSPYMFYLKCSTVEIIGSSPEIHVQLQKDDVRVRPIAGTRPRGISFEEDKRNEKELLADEKELAEHLMLVDLGRNDIGRVCVGGTVKVSDYQAVEYYSHVMHIVSNVVGKLSGEYDLFDLIKATFPAGTVSGAPKVRAMEIIEELEPERRGIYSGMIGYFSFNGDFDSCITIRTIVVKDNIAYLQAGAGIVADSNPEKEYYETIHKMKALIKAIENVGELDDINY